jgi:hypothetical protein
MFTNIAGPSISSRASSSQHYVGPYGLSLLLAVKPALDLLDLMLSIGKMTPTPENGLSNASNMKPQPLWQCSLSSKARQTPGTEDRVNAGGSIPSEHEAIAGAELGSPNLRRVGEQSQSG